MVIVTAFAVCTLITSTLRHHAEPEASEVLPERLVIAANETLVITAGSSMIRAGKHLVIEGTVIVDPGETDWPYVTFSAGETITVLGRVVLKDGTDAAADWETGGNGGSASFRAPVVFFAEDLTAGAGGVGGPMGHGGGGGFIDVTGLALGIDNKPIRLTGGKGGNGGKGHDGTEVTPYGRDGGRGGKGGMVQCFDQHARTRDAWPRPFAWAGFDGAAAIGGAGGTGGIGGSGIIDARGMQFHGGNGGQGGDGGYVHASHGAPGSHGIHGCIPGVTPTDGTDGGNGGEAVGGAGGDGGNAGPQRTAFVDPRGGAGGTGGQAIGGNGADGGNGGDGRNTSLFKKGGKGGHGGVARGGSAGKAGQPGGAGGGGGDGKGGDGGDEGAPGAMCGQDKRRNERSTE